MEQIYKCKKETIKLLEENTSKKSKSMYSWTVESMTNQELQRKKKWKIGYV
jgi:hypothetical protein